MTTTVVLPSDIASDIDEATRLPVETAGVLLVSIVEVSDGTTRLLARKLCWIPNSSYIHRGGDHLAITSEGYVPFLAEADSMGASAIWIHTHPGADGRPNPSDHDEEVDRQISDLFRLRTNKNYYGTLIFSPRTNGIAFTGYIQAEGQPRRSLNYIWEVGNRFSLTRSWDSPQINISPIFDRSVRAFGGAVQSALGQLTVGIVGCGGTGSAVTEQLTRLGVRNFILIDPQELSGSNITRVYGSTIEDVGKDKVQVLQEHIQRITHDIKCKSIKSMITLQKTALQLCECDVIFGCTDDNAGRLILSRLSTFLLTPVIDCGVLLSDDGNGGIQGIDGRITTLVPGQACLVCRSRINLTRAATELLTPEERTQRENEGYAPALGRIEPAVVTFTTLVAATAVSELLERFIGYGPEPRPSEVLLRCHDREISTNVQLPREGHYCDLAVGKLGLGITDPFLEQTWPN